MGILDRIKAYFREHDENYLELQRRITSLQRAYDEECEETRQMMDAIMHFAHEYTIEHNTEIDAYEVYKITTTRSRYATKTIINPNKVLIRAYFYDGSDENDRIYYKNCAEELCDMLNDKQ